MKPPPFLYSRPDSLEEAVAVLGEHGDDGRPLAGGQSLIPMMNFRLARPSVLVDLRRVPGLDDISISQRNLSIGSMSRQSHVMASGVVADRLPLLVEALRHVGHHQIRTRGTVGGSLAHADPAAELPAVALLLDAELAVHGPKGARTVPAAGFWQAPYTTDLAADEILTAVRFPASSVTAWSLREIARRGGDFAIVGVAATRSPDGVRLVGFGANWVPLRLTAAEAAYRDGGADAVESAASAAHDEVEPTSDVHADAAYRREATATLVRRVLQDVAA